MSSIHQSNLVKEGQLDYLKDKSRVIEKRNRELEQLESAYDQRVSLAKANYEDRLIESRKNYDLRLQDEFERKEEVLKGLNESISKTEKKLNQEHENLSANHQGRIAERQKRFDQSYYQVNLERDRELQEVSENYNTHNRKKRDELNLEAKIQELDYIGAKKELEEVFTEAGFKAKNNFKQKLDEQAKKYFQETNQTKSGQEQEKAKMIEGHNKFIDLEQKRYLTMVDNQMKYQQGHVNQLKEQFENKYEHRLQQNLNEIKQLEGLARQKLEEVKLNNTKQRLDIFTKASDEFYQGAELNPEVIEHEKEYIIKLSVPEHEVARVNLSAKQKELRLSVNREFQTEVKDAEGGLSKTKRIETLSKNMTLDHPINDKKLKKEYHDGQVIFTILKA